MGNFTAHTENPLMDWLNHANYGGIFFLGFAIAAAEGHGLDLVIQKWRWLYWGLSAIFGPAYGVTQMLTSPKLSEWNRLLISGLLG